MTNWLVAFLAKCDSSERWHGAYVSCTIADTATTKKNGDLTPDELDAGLAAFIVRAQDIAFQQDLLLLKKNLPLPGSSKLKQFSPFVDVKRYGVLRVDGRKITYLLLTYYKKCNRRL